MDKKTEFVQRQGILLRIFSKQAIRQFLTTTLRESLVLNLILQVATI